MERQLLDMQMREAVREAVEKAVIREIGRVEEHRRDVYRAYGLAAAVILALIGITSWQQIPRVVASLIRKPASGQLAQVFQRGQESANQLAQQSRIAQSKIDDLSLKLKQVQTELNDAKQISKSLAGQAQQSATAVQDATATVEKARKLQGELASELTSARETVASLKADLAVTEKFVIEMEYLQYAGRNMFPNPYHQEIINTLNKLVAVAIPNPVERDQFVKQLQAFTAPKPK
jgi:methyl-accepting chemotaxis protein